MAATERARKASKTLFSRMTLGFLGRRNTARLARMLGNEARLDTVNDQYENGEREVQAVVLRNCHPGRAAVVLDVGANVGDWTAMLLEEASRAGRAELRVVAFEPAKRTFARLSGRLAAAGSTPPLRLENVAVSDRTGEITLHVPGGDAGTSSVHGASVEVAAQPEVVRVTTVDAYCHANDIALVDLLKIDTEGHDLTVLEGARSLLAQRAIGVVQFEYNHRWIFARKFLRDAFELLQPFGYCIGKVTPQGIERYERWHHELETFREGNYLALQPEWQPRFRSFPWWNADAIEVGGSR